MVLDHLGQNFNDNDEQRLQFENMLIDGLNDTSFKHDIKKHYTEIKDETDNSMKYIPTSKMKINVFEKPSVTDKMLYKNNDSSYIYTLNNYSNRDNNNSFKKKKLVESPVKPCDFNSGIK